MDAYLENVVTPLIDRHGWMIQSVGAGTNTPGFSYTVGLCKTCRQPDIITFGLPPYLAQTLLDDLARNAAKKPLPIDTPLNGYIHDLPLYLRPVLDIYLTREYPLFSVGRVYYGTRHQLVALQLIWPDENGLFPWNGGRTQPMLDAPGLSGFRKVS